MVDRPATAKQPTLVRCAIYTRKSTEEGLEQEFNSLMAQREASEAYILSQREQGWQALPAHYDDGGFSGGNVERPALKRLLADIEAKRVDCVVVYKVDRLSRSLLDFAGIIGMLDKHAVTFVSVTQQFNTHTSLGRLTLNILLSFAQFEREIISERTRDKIYAARRKGKWTGGLPVLGYDVDPAGGRLNVNAAEAEQLAAHRDFPGLCPQWISDRDPVRNREVGNPYEVLDHAERRAPQGIVHASDAAVSPFEPDLHRQDSPEGGVARGRTRSDHPDGSLATGTGDSGPNQSPSSSRTAPASGRHVAGSALLPSMWDTHGPDVHEREEATLSLLHLPVGSEARSKDLSDPFIGSRGNREIRAGTDQPVSEVRGIRSRRSTSPLRSRSVGRPHF